MIDFITVSFLNGYAYIKKHPELLMTLLLIVVVPVAFLLSGQQFLTAAKDNQERLEKDRIGMLHDVFISFLGASAFNPEVVEGEIVHIVSLNPDITRMEVAKERGGNVVVIASDDPSRKGMQVENPDTYRIAHAHPEESIITPRIKERI